MHIKFKGEDLGEWKGAPRLKEARIVKQKVGLLPQEFVEAVSVMDPDALCMLVSLMYARNGKVVPYETIDGEYEDFQVELSETEKTQQAEREVALLAPALTKALRELGVNPDEARVAEVVLRHIEEAQREAAELEEGKGELESLAMESLATVTSISTEEVSQE